MAQGTIKCKTNHYVDYTATTDDAGRIANGDLANDFPLSVIPISPNYASVTIGCHTNKPYLLYFRDASSGQALISTSVTYRVYYNRVGG